MKIYIRASKTHNSKNTSYTYCLQQICKSLIEDGRNAVVNRDARCVDVLDDLGMVCEQHYPTELEPTEGVRGRYKKVEDGQGNYICIKSKYEKRNFTPEDPFIKYLSKTNR